jgi:hypothetical protein
VQVNIVERDPVYDDYLIPAPVEVTLNVPTSKPYSTSNESPPYYKSGTQSRTFHVKAIGGDKGKTADYTLNFWWAIVSSAEDVADLIRERMAADRASADFNSIKKKNDLAEQMYRQALDVYYGIGEPEWSAMGASWEDIQGLLAFRNMVKGGAAWDYKKAIRDEYGKWSADPKRGVVYYFDIWGNIHFGYIGTAIGFTETRLLDGAGIAHAIENKSQPLSKIIAAVINGGGRKFDDPLDQVAIRVGIGLWKRHGAAVTAKQILAAVRRSRSKLHHGDAKELKPPRSFS